MKCTVSEKFEMCGGGRIILPATLVSSSEVLIAVSLRHMYVCMCIYINMVMYSKSFEWKLFSQA